MGGIDPQGEKERELSRKWEQQAQRQESQGERAQPLGGRAASTDKGGQAAPWAE